jgi:hypothetical protein
VNRVEQLKAGLAALGPMFNADLCVVCDGEGRYRQTYTAGCGMGSFQSMGDCDYCARSGVRQGTYPAPESVVNQVLNAGRAALSSPQEKP